jgi:hypothetical protein
MEKTRMEFLFEKWKSINPDNNCLSHEGVAEFAEFIREETIQEGEDFLIKQMDDEMNKTRNSNLKTMGYKALWQSFEVKKLIHSIKLLKTKQ